MAPCTVYGSLLSGYHDAILGMKVVSIPFLNQLIRSSMDNKRLFLSFIAAFLGLMIYQAWMDDYGAKPAVESSPRTTESVPPATLDDSGVPTASVKAELSATISSNDQTGSTVADIVYVETDLVKAEISTRGGTIQRLELLDYAVDNKKPDVKVQLFSPTADTFYIAQSGLLGVNPESAPNHDAIYKIDQQSFKLTEGEDELKVSMLWSGPNGITVKKEFIFHRGSYLIDVRHQVINGGEESWTARDYSQLQRTEPTEGSRFTTYSYTGGVYYTIDDKYSKITFEEMAEKSLNLDSAESWTAMIQHYFVSAWIPPAEQVEHFYSNSLPGGRYLLGSYSPSITVAAGETRSFDRKLFVGPKLQDVLEPIAKGLELTVDYGWLTVIAVPIHWVLKQIHQVVGNWGWAIIILTILIKAIFYKLSETSYKSMANMRKLTPRLQALKDRYGDDKQRLNQAMMDLYKTEKVNPLGGCLPIVVQIPVFIALYWVLLESVEMRHAPFMLWIDNLSVKDPYFVLPLIMGVSMFIQQKLNPAPPDPMQAKIMMSLPFIFTIFFAFFPAGLVLYWVVNNIVSITQQWYITRKIEQGGS
jgi:YidC/Oxa1 family membrane protein insertase